MRSEELDSRIVFVAPKTVEFKFGEQKTKGWEEVASRWAKYSPVSDGEKLRAAAVEQRTDARFLLRHSASTLDLIARCRFRYDGDLWKIGRFKVIGRREWLELTAHRLDGAEA